MFPQIDLDESFDDNVYRTPDDAKDDFLFTVSPDLKLRSQWSQHRLDISAGMSRYQYSKLHTESRTDWNVGAVGRIDILRGLTADATATYNSTHEPRTSPDSPIAALEPTKYTAFHADGDIDEARGRFGLRVGALYNDYRFSPTRLVDGSFLDNTTRNWREFETFAKGDYEFSPGYAAFVRAAINKRDYDLDIDAGGINRNSSGYRIDTGVDMQLSQLIVGNFYVGYLQQRYKAPLTDVQGFDYGAGLTWFTTDLVTLHLDASRQIDETTIANAAAGDVQQVSAGVDYAFRPNVLVQGKIDFTHYAFSGASRSDSVIDMSLGAKYLLNEYMNLSARYQYGNRDSSLPQFGYADNTIIVGLGLQL